MVDSEDTPPVSRRPHIVRLALFAAVLYGQRRTLYMSGFLMVIMLVLSASLMYLIEHDAQPVLHAEEAFLQPERHVPGLRDRAASLVELVEGREGEVVIHDGWW